MVKYVSYPRSDHVQNISAESKYFVTFQNKISICPSYSPAQDNTFWYDQDLLPSVYMQQVTTFTLLNKEININE